MVGTLSLATLANTTQRYNSGDYGKTQKEGGVKTSLVQRLVEQYEKREKLGRSWLLLRQYFYQIVRMKLAGSWMHSEVIRNENMENLDQRKLRRKLTDFNKGKPESGEN
eukprot:TRINITY_DN1906_c0_g1_i1.p5 TRINITY_DN1906_c0_g1~~TRINITY_DN1906_c0_g1_i1.p5  ORF type:complete len:109 (+),score=12.43 TRINITY_DN1906_c0_g1_i1:1184-1510(+)